MFSQIADASSSERAAGAAVVVAVVLMVVTAYLVSRVIVIESRIDGVLEATAKAFRSLGDAFDQTNEHCKELAERCERLEKAVELCLQHKEAERAEFAD